MKKTFIRFLGVLIFLLGAFNVCYGSQETYVISPQDSYLNCSIKYTAVGRYRAVFTDFNGVIKYDNDFFPAGYVKMAVKTESLKSKYPSLDSIVLSSRLLDAKQYPEMSFESISMQVKNGISYVTGRLSLHGVTQIVTLPFSIEEYVQKDSAGFIVVKGKWKIYRKDFDIFWHKILDRGSFLVGNYVVIDWQIKAVKEN